MAAVVAWLATWVVRAYARRRLLDQPNERSSHSVPTPRGGGLGLVIGIGAGCALIPFGVSCGWALPVVLMAMAAMAGLGWWDDHANIPARHRLVLQFVLVGVVAGMIGIPDQIRIGGWSVDLPSLVLWPLMVVGGVWVVNLTNFMDGIDGIAGTQGAVGCLGLAWLMIDVSGVTGVLPLAGGGEWLVATAGACVGFLVWNRPPATIFMGDVGSTAVGLVLAGGVMMALKAGVAADVALLPLMPFIADATCTLVRRAWRRERLSQAHRSHLYQRLARHWGGHLPVTALYGGLAILGLGLAVMTGRQSIPGGIGMIGWCGLFSLVAWYGHRVAPATPPVMTPMHVSASSSLSSPSSPSSAVREISP